MISPPDVGRKIQSICQSCRREGPSIFHRVTEVPAHSVLLMPTREAALTFPKGNITLGYCSACGFIGNLAFESRLLEYSQRYEETQGYSPTYTSFARRQADDLISRYGLRNKEIIEIGCGKGEFLTLLCELGGNRGIGFDPSYVPGRYEAQSTSRVSFMNDFYSEKYADCQADFICCRMTLEHIPQTGEFVQTLRRSIGRRPDTVVFFQVPNVVRILRDLAFWDIYYEHCSYFSAASLARLFATSQFDVLRTWTDYEDQYLMIEARPVDERESKLQRWDDGLGVLEHDVETFQAGYRAKLEQWRERLRVMSDQCSRAVIWGSGSKGVSFLTTLGIRDEIQYAVDINPHRQGTYMAGTGQEIVAPEFLPQLKPDYVIVMNPVYRHEIQLSLDRMGLAPKILTP
jgi:2-polyprenyl-3-methyl-5-hydroxy-6-metoxy-1,4-benzoquinol methylase